jgi:hypothetical protein
VKKDKEMEKVKEILTDMAKHGVTIKKMDKIADIIYDKRTGLKKKKFQMVI